MNNIEYPLILQGEVVDLISLEREHLPALEQLARDKRIWEFISHDLSAPEKFYAEFNSALAEREKGTQFPFVIVHTC